MFFLFLYRFEFASEFQNGIRRLWREPLSHLISTASNQDASYNCQYYNRVNFREIKNLRNLLDSQISHYAFLQNLLSRFSIRYRNVCMPSTLIVIWLDTSIWNYTALNQSIKCIYPMQSYYVKKSIWSRTIGSSCCAHFKYGVNTFYFRSIILWNSLPATLKQSKSCIVQICL